MKSKFEMEEIQMAKSMERVTPKNSSQEEKQKALEEALASIEKQFGKVQSCVWENPAPI